jgi:hypothetical protein
VLCTVHREIVPGRILNEPHSRIPVLGAFHDHEEAQQVPRALHRDTGRHEALEDR